MVDRDTKLRWEREDAARSQRVQDGLGGVGDSAPRSTEPAGADAPFVSPPPLPPFGGAQVGGSPSFGSPAKPSIATQEAIDLFRLGMELGARIERNGGSIA